MLGIGHGAAHVARIGLLARTVSLPDHIPAGRWHPGKPSRLRYPARAEILLRLGCAISASSGLRLGSAIAVDAPNCIDSTVGLRLGAGAEIRIETAIEAGADMVDVVLEALLMAD